MFPEVRPLLREKHVRFFKRFIITPPFLKNHDNTRISILFFCVSGLEVLNALDKEINDDLKKDICNWIYRLQILPDLDGNTDKCGFQGSDTFHIMLDHGISHCNSEFATGHLAMTFCSLSVLLLLGDDFSRLNRNAILKGVGSLQQEDGCFSAVHFGSEKDMRFVYCACCICYILKDWSFDIDKTVRYIQKSMSYDYGYGQGPDLESHGGVTFCAVASLFLMGKLDTTLSQEQLQGLRKWALMRQEFGFQGRANKRHDTCYSFWVGATLKILDFYDKTDYDKNREFVLSTQDNLIGGFSKWVDYTPDPLHTYLGLAGLSFIGKDDLLEIHPALNISSRAVNFLHKLQNSWVS
ncbi:geranylgeranyl transferase type-1 subunit beta [Cimex lectularius]|uniref:Geranylgeranyl transferase type-1 subunit beta n=1 Tax=Cimex lectularius TaxID=79782 RepID=A0A8I6TKD6_CIMLE|nr:geranylgeranyl transferase type-1 subunit beta [Cimex lectularius]